MNMSGLRSKNDKNISESSSNNPNNHVDNNNQDETNIGQGELYSPDHAIKINPNKHNKKNNNLGEEKGNSNNNNSNSMVIKGVASDIRSRMSSVKDRVIEKLAAASVPSDKLDNARTYFESIIRDVTSAAQGITKEALIKIKSHLADILPSLSPSVTSKMVDEAEKEAEDKDNNREDQEEMKDEKFDEHQKGKTISTSPASSFFSPHLMHHVSRL